jgi:hypothetical protein
MMNGPKNADLGTVAIGMRWRRRGRCPSDGLERYSVRSATEVTICSRSFGCTYRNPATVGTRPPGILCVTDRVLHRGVAEVPGAISKQDFLPPLSFGIPPGRGAHHAFATLDRSRLCRTQAVTQGADGTHSPRVAEGQIYWLNQPLRRDHAYNGSNGNLRSPEKVRRFVELYWHKML